MKKDKIIINIDESWLPQTFFKYHRWTKKAERSSIPCKEISPRISLIMALSSDGDIYSSITQVNTDSKIMSLYIKELCKILDNKDRNWRKTHLFLVDGASYHQANSTFNVLRNLHIPIMLLSPFSYDAAPIEKIFNALKSSDINPDLLPTAKRYFCSF